MSFHTFLNTHYISSRPEAMLTALSMSRLQRSTSERQCSQILARAAHTAQHSFCAEIKGAGFPLEQSPNMLLAFQRHQPNHCFSRNTKTSTSIHPVLYLYGRFSCQVRHQEVHGDVLAVDVLIHHVADGLRHHVGVQVGVVLGKG